MNKALFSTSAIIMFLSACATEQPKVEWVATTATSSWETQAGLTISKATNMADVEIKPDQPLQTIEVFVSCFNELG